MQTEEWRPRWYYVMVNKTTGKKYLGQTVQIKINGYCGSGQYWVKHNRKHGGHNRNNISILWCDWFVCKESAQSFLDTFALENPDYPIADNLEWANQVYETADDSAFSGLKGIKQSEDKKIKQSSIMKDLNSRPEVKSEIARKSREAWSRPETRELMVAANREALMIRQFLNPRVKLPKDPPSESYIEAMKLKCWMTHSRKSITSEHKTKIAESKYKEVLCHQTQQLFRSLKDAGKWLFENSNLKNTGTAEVCIKRYIAGTRKSPMNGYTFTYTK